MAAGTREVLAPVLRGVRAVVFDTDGVITDSARVHAAAWKTAFDAFLRDHPPEDPAPAASVRHTGTTICSTWTASPASTAPPPSWPRAASTRPPATVRAVAADKERLFTERLREKGIDA